MLALLGVAGSAGAAAEDNDDGGVLSIAVFQDETLLALVSYKHCGFAFDGCAVVFLVQCVAGNFQGLVR